MRLVLLLVVALIIYLLYAGRLPFPTRVHDETEETPGPAGTPAGSAYKTPFASPAPTPAASGSGSPSSGLRRPIDRARAVRDAVGAQNRDTP